MPQMQLQPQPAPQQTRRQEEAYSRSTYTEPKVDHEEIRRQQEARRQEEIRRQQEAAAQEKLRREAELRAQEELRRRQEIEREELISSHHEYLRTEWVTFQRKSYDLPPELLPLEAKAEFQTFKKYIEANSQRTIRPEAFTRFEQDLASKAQEAEKALAAVTASLSRANLFAFGQLGAALKGYSLSAEAPPLSSPAAEALKSARRLLRLAWSKGTSLAQQAILSLYKSGGKTVIQVGSSLYGCFYITLPTSLAPEELARQLMKKISGAFNSFIKRRSIVAIYDGDYQSVNPKCFLTDHIVIRTTKNDSDAFLAKMPQVIEREAPNSKNSSLHIAVPTNEGELRATFPGGQPDWDLWQDVASDWQRRATNNGFSLEHGADSEAILSSLAVEKNVIIVASHARERILYLPAPPPEGSQIRPSDLARYKEQISDNKPMVYLFCCKTAELSDVKGFVETLLEYGAAAVVAPQSEIDAHESAELFQRLTLTSSSRESVSALERLREAEQRTGYREMEVWIS